MDKGSSTTYVKGDLVRVDDDGFGNEKPCANPDDGSSVSKCGMWSAIRLKRGFYEITNENSEDTAQSQDAASPGNAKSSGVVRVILESVDTGERKKMLGYLGRHIVTTANIDVSRSSCGVNQTAHKYDGWYIDPPYKNKCSESDDARFRIEFERISECNDKVLIENRGPSLGYGLKERLYSGCDFPR